MYAFFETGNLIATDHDGKSLWQRMLNEDYGAVESNIGLAASPILVNDVLVILVDHEGPSYLLGVDVKTGETRWKTDRTSRTSYSSPALVPIGGATQIVVSSAGSIDGFDPKTGEMLWTYEEGIGGNRASTPLAIGDGLFAIGASPGMHNEREAEAKKTNFVMQVESVDGKYVPKILWKTEEAMTSHCSPIAYGGYAYWVNRAGVVYCFDLKTGKTLYAKRANGVCWATPVGVGDRVYFFSKDGMTTVLQSGPEHHVLAENMLWDPEKVGRDSMSRDRSSGEHQGHGGEAAAGSATSSVTRTKSVSEATTGDDKKPSDAEAKKPVDSQPSESAENTPTERRRGRRDSAEGSGGRGVRGNGEGGGRPPMTEKEREEN
ncbi:MAG: PQQ-like beta-propeller repeat protein, partial [Planctomycetes bacterium]|nr:PQQ-like beta-propeller repeat protein [Planctomycetota bacterium]